MPTGIFYGITTNPLIMANAGFVYADICWTTLAQTAADLGAKEFHVQVYGDSAKALKFAERIYAVENSVDIECVVKIPLSLEGIGLVPRIKDMGGKILLTACYDAKQMIVASALEVDYIAPYFSRMIDAGEDAMAHMLDIKEMSLSSSCRPLVASLRNAKQIVDIARLGHDCFTISAEVAYDLLQNELTNASVADFEKIVAGEIL